MVAWLPCCCSVTRSCLNLCNPMDCAHQTSLSSTISELIQRSHSTIASSIIRFFSCLLQSFPASGSFPRSQFFTSGGHSIGASASTSVLPVNIQDYFPLRLTGWISLLSKGLSRVFPTPQFKTINSLVLSFLYSPTLTSVHDYWKNHSLD